MGTCQGGEAPTSPCSLRRDVATLAPNRLLPVFGIVSAALVGAVLGPGALRPLTVLVPVAGAAAAVLAVVLSIRVGYAALIVLLIGASIDALPGPTVGGLTNPAMFGLAAVLAWAGRRNLPRLPPWLVWSSVALFVWVVIGMMRAYQLGAPLRPTLRLGLDFALFAILLPLFVAAFQDRVIRSRAIAGLVALAAWVALVNIAASLGFIPPSGGFLAHAYNSYEAGGITRLYTLNREVVTASIPFALGAVLFAKTARQRTVSLGLLLLLLAEALLALGRVKYVGLTIMAVVMMALWARRRSALRATGLVFALVAAVWTAANVGPLQTTVSDLGQRINSIFASTSERQAYEGTDTARYRAIYAAQIRGATTPTEWIVGRGFLPSPWYYFAPDANRTLRNSDLGFYNAVNTMGIVGLLLLIAPVVGIGAACWKRRRHAGSDTWLLFGSMGFALYAIVVSQTLVVLFSAPGLTVAACALALGFAAAPRRV